MLILIAVGFAAGIVTALSPCVLPVLPIVLAGGATGRRPLAIVAGIVASFTVFTLFAAWLLDLVGLPEDLLRDLAIALLFVVALTLLWPWFAELLARPLQALTRRGSGDLGGGFLLGASLGLVFVPCAGPVLAAVTVIAAKRDVGFDGVLLTLSYAIGAALPMLAIAFAGQRVSRSLRTNAETVRRGAGVLVAVAAIAIAFGLDQKLQTKIPGYTESIQNRFERSDRAQKELRELTGAQAPQTAAGNTAEAELDDFGPAPKFTGVAAWLNSKPLTIQQLHGRVVLIDFWTYSCINCLRTLPHIKAWDERYRQLGLTIVGVHTPEFAFEHKESNVRENVKRLGLRYPIALDNDYGTWQAWTNNYWPAKYLIDRAGHVRFYHFGEGEYAKTEATIRTLLAEPRMRLPAASNVADESPHGELTPESYLGYQRLTGAVAAGIGRDAEHTYSFPTTPVPTEIAYAGRWKIGGQRAIAGQGARLRLLYRARNVYLVLTGRGSVAVLVDGKHVRTVHVRTDQLYTLVERPEIGDHLLELRFTPGVAGYAFTFG